MSVAVAIGKMIAPRMDLHQRFGMILLRPGLLLPGSRKDGHTHAVRLIQIIEQQHIPEDEFTVVFHLACPPCLSFV